MVACKKLGESKRIDLTGQRFFRLTVLEYAEEDKQVYYSNAHKPTWKCKCDCGSVCYATTESLRRGDTKSCGCITKERMHAQLKDLSGKRFGHLFVLQFVGTRNHNSVYRVRCDCGKEYEVNASGLKQGTTRSCGCIRESHGELKIREILENNGVQFVNQKRFNDLTSPFSSAKLRYDFYLPQLNVLIEYDGFQHFYAVNNWGGEDGLNKRQLVDDIKNNYAKENNYILIRIPYTHYNSIVLDDLLPNSKFRLEC